MRTAVVAAALLVSLSSFTHAEGGGGTGGGMGTSLPTSGSAATGGTRQVVPSGVTTGVNSTVNNTQNQTVSAVAQQRQRNRGMGTAPNGLPIGARGSGLGSPEHPHDAGARR